MRQPVTAIDIRRDLVGLLPKLRRFAMTLTGDVASADELVQAVCQKAITKIHLWNGEGRLESWVYTMARHQWMDEMRKHRLRAGGGKHNAMENHQPMAAVAHDASSDATEIHAMIASMPEGLASVLLLVDVEGHSYKQASEIMGISVETVNAQLCAARLQCVAKAEDSNGRRF